MANNTGIKYGLFLSNLSYLLECHQIINGPEPKIEHPKPLQITRQNSDKKVSRTTEGSSTKKRLLSKCRLTCLEYLKLKLYTCR